MDSDHRPTPYEDAALTTVLLRQKQMPQLDFANNGIGFSSYNMVGETNGGRDWDRTNTSRFSVSCTHRVYDPSKKMVGRDGLEPPTFRVSAEGSNQLSYLPMESEAGIEPSIITVLQTAP